MCIADKGVVLQVAGIELVSTVDLSSPKLSARNEEVASSTDKTSKCIAGQVRRGAPRDQITSDIR